MSNNEPISEEEASIIMNQIFEALSYVHSCDYMHRDLKPENILFARKNDINSIFLIDFGIGSKYEMNKYPGVNSREGTFTYMAPEQFESGQCSKVGFNRASGYVGLWDNFV